MENSYEKNAKNFNFRRALVTSNENVRHSKSKEEKNQQTSKKKEYEVKICFHQRERKDNPLYHSLK